MNKFKSVVLLSFLYVGSQAGFSAEQHPGENNAGVLPPQIAGINLEQGQAKLQQVPQNPAIIARDRNQQRYINWFQKLRAMSNSPEMNAEELKDMENMTALQLKEMFDLEERQLDKKKVEKLVAENSTLISDEERPTLLQMRSYKVAELFEQRKQVQVEVKQLQELLQKNNMPEMSAEEKQNLLLQTPKEVKQRIKVVNFKIKLVSLQINEINVLRVEKNMPKLSAEEEQYLRNNPNELERLLETQKNGKQLNELRAKNGLPYISDDELQHMQDGGRQLDQEIEFQETMLDLPKLLERNGIQMSPEDIQKMSPADRVKEAWKQSKVTQAREAVESIGVQMSNEQLQGMSYDALEELCQKAQCIKTLNMPLTSSQDMLLKKLDELKESCTKQYLVNKIEALRSYMIATEQQKDPQEDLQNESVPQLENLYKQLQKKHRERNQLLKALEEVREKTGLQTSAEELKQLPLRELEQLEEKEWNISRIVYARASKKMVALSREELQSLRNMTITELDRRMFDELVE